MFVGEAPGRHGADRTGRPFEGDRSGDLFQEALDRLHEAHGKRLRVFVTNAVKCNPRDDEDRNRPPTSLELRECSSHLHSEIQALRPKVVVALGAKAARSVLGTVDFSWWEAVGASPRVFPAVHPGFVVRGGGRERLTREQYFRRLARVLDEL